MNPYMLLIPVFVLCVAGSGLSYTDDLRRSPWYTFWMVVLGGACAGLFAWGAKLLDDRERLYVFSLWYDSTLYFCYYGLPILLFATRPSPGVLLGTVIVLAGLVVVKVSS